MRIGEAGCELLLVLEGVGRGSSARLARSTSAPASSSARSRFSIRAAAGSPTSTRSVRCARSQSRARRCSRRSRRIPGRRRADRGARRTLPRDRVSRRTALLAVGVGLALADSSIVTLALPKILGEFDVAITSVAWVLTSFNLVLAVVAVPAAYVSRRRPREAFVVGVLVFAAASLACGLAPSFDVLVGARCVQAVGAALLVTSALDLLSQVGGGDERALRVWVAAGVLGAAVGPAAGGILTQLLGWESIFLAQVPLALVLLLAARGVAGRPVPAPAGRPSLAANAALLLVAGGLVAALFLVVLLLVEGWGMSPAAAGLVVTVMPLTAIAVGAAAAALARRGQGVASGVILVAGGLAALALMPRAGWGWTIPPQILVGAGLGLTVAGLTELALRGRADQVVHGGWTLAARHAGVVARPAPARAGAHERARREPRRGDSRGRRRRPRQRDPAARQARCRAGRARARSTARTRPASCPTSSALRGPAGRRRVAHARSRPPGPARPRGHERLLGPVPARRGADAVRARAGRSSCGGGPREAFRSRSSSRSRSSRAVVVPYLALGGGRFEPTPVADPCDARERPGAGGSRRDDRGDRARGGRRRRVRARRLARGARARAPQRGGLRRVLGRATGSTAARSSGRSTTASSVRWTTPRSPERFPGLVAPLVRRAAESVPPWLILEALEQLGSFLPG